jgi:hypothetical protein
MANPVKTGDAKPWVYRHTSGHDCQASENDDIHRLHQTDIHEGSSL